jgi:hypothetical protein
MGIDDGMVAARFIVSDDVERSRRSEIRCYIRDPDGYIIEVGQTTLARGRRPPS